jgi:signal peptidase II
MSKTRYRIGFAVIFAVIVADQLSKWLVRDYVDVFNPNIAITSFFNITYVWNKGVSFGLLNQLGDWGPYILSGLTLIVILFLTYWLVTLDKSQKLIGWALPLIIGGAFGNLIDRFTFGAVFDFLDFHIGASHFWAFNIADSAITCGGALFVLDFVVNAFHKKAH